MMFSAVVKTDVVFKVKR